MASIPTLIEGARAAQTVIEGQPATPGGGVSEVSLTPGAQFLEYQLIAPIKVASGEADLWVVARQGQQFVLKLYRWGLRPKSEIGAKLSAVSKEHIVAVQAQGVVADGRHYEILEHIRHGSLADLARAGLTQPRVREVLAELTSAVAALHAENILHRDLKPGNVLVRTVEPLDLVLADFGISSVLDLSLHVTSVNRTAAYGAPEAMTGVVSKASDWWSVGVIVLELLLGRHPLAGLDERVVNFTLVTRGVPVPATLPAEWQTVLKGLLTRDHTKRWGAAQLTAWLAGRRDLPVHYRAAEEEQASHHSAHRPYKFGGQEFSTAEALAVALAENWDEGVKHLCRKMITDWVRTQLADQELTSRLMDLAEDTKLNSDQQLMVALMVLHPAMPLTWRGEVVNEAWLAGNPEVALALLASTVPEWVARLRRDQWLLVTRDWRQQVMDRMREAGVAHDQRLVDRLALSTAEKVEEVALEVWETYGGSTDARIEKLFQQTELSLKDAILLAACDRKLLQTERQRREIKARADAKAAAERQRVAEAKAQALKIQEMLRKQERLLEQAIAANTLGNLRTAKACLDATGLTPKNAGEFDGAYKKAKRGLDALQRDLDSTQAFCSKLATELATASEEALSRFREFPISGRSIVPKVADRGGVVREWVATFSALRSFGHSKEHLLSRSRGWSQLGEFAGLRSELAAHQAKAAAFPDSEFHRECQPLIEGAYEILNGTDARLAALATDGTRRWRRKVIGVAAIASVVMVGLISLVSAVKQDRAAAAAMAAADAKVATAKAAADARAKAEKAAVEAKVAAEKAAAEAKAAADAIAERAAANAKLATEMRLAWTGAAMRRAGFFEDQITRTLTEGGKVFAWGGNDARQCNVPTGLSGVVAIAAGEEHTVALKKDGTVVAWGYDGFREATVPKGLSGVTAIAAGDGHTVALKNDGTVVIWANDGFRNAAVPNGLSGVTAIAAGATEAFALKGSGQVEAWKIWNGNQSSIPSGISSVVAIAAGWNHAVGLKSNGLVMAWGSDGRGQSSVPVGLSGVVAIAAGHLHTLALKKDGTLVAWGLNDFGQVTGTAATNIFETASTTVTFARSGVSNQVVAVAAGKSHSVALKKDGTLVVWGSNEKGQRNIPAGLSNVVAIAAGKDHTVALTLDASPQAP